MSYAVMPLSDYKAACDKVREKVDLTTVKFEKTDFGFLRSGVFTVPKDGMYIFSYEFSDSSKFVDLYFASPEWEGESSPGYFEPIDSNSAKTTLYAGGQYRIFITDSLGLTPKDILKASLSLDEETVVDFVPHPKIKSGELAEKVDEVYWTAANDFGLKGKGQGELVTLNNVHPIEHKVEVGLSSKNLFNEAEADITKTEDYFVSNVNYSQAPCFTLKVESGATYTATVEYYTPNTVQFAQIIAFTFSREKTYTDYEKSIYVRLKTQDSTNGYVKDIKTFTIPDGVEEIYFIANNDETYFKNVMVEKNSTATAYAPFVADFSDCKVKVRGKNLLNINREFSTLSSGNVNTSVRKDFDYSKYYLGLAMNNYYYPNFIEATIEENTITYKGKSTPYYGIAFPFKVMPDTVYSFSCVVSADKARQGLAVSFYDKDGAYISNTTNTTFTTPSNCYTAVFLLRAPDTTNTYTASDIQVEIGTTATEYEPYTETEYTANADGTVENVKSISPVMNILADKAGAVIDAECFLDPQAVITDLTNTVITLGGEI